MIDEGERITKDADDKGRIYLGTQLAGQTVTVDVVKIGGENKPETLDRPTHCAKCGGTIGQQWVMNDSGDGFHPGCSDVEW